MRCNGCLVKVCVACCICVSAAAQQQKEAQGQEQQGQGKWEGQKVESLPTDARGNWYIKRQYVKEAEKVYRSIREAQKEAEKLRNTLTEQRNAISQAIQGFHCQYHIETEKLMNRITSILQTIDQEDGKELSEEERDWREKARGFKASLEDIQEHMTSLQKLRDGADKAVSLFEEQLDVIDGYEEKAWETYQSIAQTVSDRVAEEYYRQLQGMSNNTDQVVAYINKELVPFIENVKSQTDTYINRLKEAIQKIEEGGVTLREEIEQQEEQQPAEQQQGEQQQKEQQGEQKQKEQQQQEKQPEQEPEAPWWSRTWTWIVDTVSATGAWFVSIWNTLLSYIGLGAQES